MHQIVGRYLLFILSYHILHTIIVYGVGWGDSFVVSALKDILRIALTMIAICSMIPILRGQKRPIRRLTYVFFLMTIGVSVLITLKNAVPLLPAIVGTKYDLYPLFVLLSSGVVGIRYRRRQTGKSIDGRLAAFGKTMIVVLTIGLGWQTAKVLLPEAFQWFGYGPVGDYVLGGAPPVYYRTGPGGVARLSGIFAGPNNYGYFLVAFFSLFIYWIRNGQMSVIQKNIWYILYGLSLFWTLSRGARVGVAIQCVALVWLFSGKNMSWKRMRPYILGGGTAGVALLLVISMYKSGSTIGHMLAWQDGWQAFLVQPRGYGLGSSGPSVHFSGVYLPENQYLQVLLDIGFVGFLFWLGTIFLYLLDIGVSAKFPFNVRTAWTKEQIILLMLCNGFLGLLVEGMFLHTLEDSMVNYLLFIALGLSVGYITVQRS